VDKLRPSPPSRGRGLKLPIIDMSTLYMLVAPFAGAWIETIKTWIDDPLPPESPPSRGRGLKRVDQQHDPGDKRVAPFAGAWIETCRRAATRCCFSSRPLRGGVD